MSHPLSGVSLILSVLRQRNFGLLWVGQLISQLGDWVLIIALPIYVYELTGSALATGAMFVVQFLPPVFLGTLGGVFADRWDRRRTMIVADLARALLLSALLLVRSPDWLWIVYIVAFSESCIAQFFNPAKDAIIPTLVGSEHLVQANSLSALSQNMARLIGPALGGLLLAQLGLATLVLIDCCSYVVSGILIALIVLPPRSAPQDNAQGRVDVKQVWSELVAGLGVVRQSALITIVFIGVGLVGLGEGLLMPSFVPFIENVLQGSSIEFGLIASAQAVGGIIAGTLIGEARRRVKPTNLLAVGCLLNGILLFGIFNSQSLYVVLALFVLAGFPIVALSVGANTLLQAGVTDEYRGRVFGAYGTTFALMTVIGSTFATLVTDRVGVVPILNLDAALYILAGLLAFFLFRRVTLPQAVAVPQQSEG